MGGVTLGYAIAFHCLSHPTKGYLYLMNMISEKLQLFFERQKQDNSRTEESYQTFLAGILGNPDMSERQVSEQAGHIAGLHTEGKFLLAQLQYNRIDEMSYSFISWSLRNSMPQFMPFVYRNSFYILKDCSRTEQEGEYSFVTEKEKPLFAKCFKNIDYACGISGLFFSLKKLSTAAVQCREALSIGQSDVWHQINADFAKSDDHSGSKFYRYDDISFVYILSQLRKVMSLESMESPYFKLLKDYDRSTESNLCGVMAQYILCGCSVTKTAAKTYMHRNTILNKVRRAGQIMGNSLEDFTSQVFFMMSYVNNLTE
jgi:sugar diacid utilization regulator